MESGDEAVLRSRSRAIPTMPTFPDLDNSMEGELSPEKRKQGGGDDHITSNGEKISNPSLVEPRLRAVTSDTVDLLTQQMTEIIVSANFLSWVKCIVHWKSHVVISSSLTAFVTSGTLCMVNPGWPWWCSTDKMWRWMTFLEEAWLWNTGLAPYIKTIQVLCVFSSKQLYTKHENTMHFFASLFWLMYALLLTFSCMMGGIQLMLEAICVTDLS